jgi:hypothetical protein
VKGKRVQFDDETWAALDLLANDRMMDFQELADEAFRDVLKKHGRPIDLKEALRKRARASAQIVPFPNRGLPRKDPIKKRSKKTVRKRTKR